MKRKNIILVTLLIISGFFAMQSCKEDDTTFVTKQAFTTPVATSPVVRADGTVLFTGTTVDLKWNSENTGGDAVAWDVYFGTGKQPALYQSGVTANQITVPVVDGQKYNWRVAIKDERGVVTTSKINSFIAVNGLNPKIKINLDCTTDVKDAIGVDLKPDEVVDVRLLILKKSDLSVLATIDAAKSAEVYEKLDTMANGEYIFAVDVASTINAGAINAPINLSFTLKFFQLGMVDETLEFAKVITNENPCDLFRTHLATVVKAGPVYTITKTLENWMHPSLSDPLNLVGTWQGWDADPGYASEVTTTYSGGKLIFTGIGRGWMQDAWGEVIVTENPIEATIDMATGDITIASQQIMTTTYNGDPQPAYTIKGSGKFKMGCSYPAIQIEYDFYQGTTGIAHYLGVPYFDLVLTLDPDGLKAIKEAQKQLAKPTR